MTPNLSPKEARALAKEMAKFPAMFAAAVFFGKRPSREQSAEINNGTITLIDLGNGPIGITCYHVIDEYRNRHNEDPSVVFQIGNADIDPLAQMIGSLVFKPITWPPESLKEGDYVAFTGFPGSLRTVTSFDELDFPCWSSGASQVSSVSERQFVSAFEREYWVSSFGENHYMELNALGGMSGGPAFIHRGLSWDFVGIISEYSEEYDAVFFTSIRMINTDGTIEIPPT